MAEGFRGPDLLQVQWRLGVRATSSQYHLRFSESCSSYNTTVLVQRSNYIFSSGLFETNKLAGVRFNPDTDAPSRSAGLRSESGLDSVHAAYSSLSGPARGRSESGAPSQAQASLRT